MQPVDERNMGTAVGRLQRIRALQDPMLQMVRPAESMDVRLCGPAAPVILRSFRNAAHFFLYHCRLLWTAFRGWPPLSRALDTGGYHRSVMHSLRCRADLGAGDHVSAGLPQLPRLPLPSLWCVPVVAPSLVVCTLPGLSSCSCNRKAHSETIRSR